MESPKLWYHAGRSLSCTIQNLTAPKFLHNQRQERDRVSFYSLLKATKSC